MDGQVTKVSDSAVEVSTAGATLSVPAGRCEDGLESGASVRLAIKPEVISVNREKSAFPVTVDVASFVGPITEYKLQFLHTGAEEPQILTAIESNVEGVTTVYHAGEEVFMHINADQARVYRN